MRQRLLQFILIFVLAISSSPLFAQNGYSGTLPDLELAAAPKTGRVTLSDEEREQQEFILRTRLELSDLTTKFGRDCSLNKTPGSSTAPISASAEDELVMVRSLADGINASMLYDYIGHCTPSDGKNNLARRKLIPDLKAYFSGANMPILEKSDGKLASAADWTAVDLVARTLFAEIASSDKCGDEYVRAVGKVMLNRKRLMDSESKYWKRYASAKGDFETHPLTEVVLHRNQFAVWNGDDAANKWAACPSKETVQKIPMGNGRFVTSGPAQRKNWERAVKVAFEMVFHEEQFFNSTAELRDTMYTAGPDELKRKTTERTDKDNGPAKKGEHLYQQVVPKINGRPVNNVNCVNLWRDRTLDWRAPNQY